MRKPNPLREQIRRLEALVKADRAERRAAEKPLRAERRALTERIRLLRLHLKRSSERRERMLIIGHLTGTERDAEWIHGQCWRDNAATLAKLRTDLPAAEHTLATFDTKHPELHE